MLFGTPQAILGHEPRPVKHASGLLDRSASSEVIPPVSLAGVRGQTLAYRDLARGGDARAGQRLSPMGSPLLGKLAKHWKS